MKDTTDYKRSILIGTLAGIGLALSFTAGFLLRDFVNLPTGAFRDRIKSADAEGYPLVDEVQFLLDQVYLREQVDYEQRQYAAIKGILLTLEDPFTFFAEPPVAQSEAHALAGTYGGIGVLIQRTEAGEFALYPFDNSPAAEAGIQDGDILIAINGEKLEITQQQDGIDQKLRGEVKDNNGVEIVFRHPFSTEEISADIEFSVINVPSVLWRVLAEDERIGYVQILRFTNRTPDELESALIDLNDTNISALVLDLRNNSGGLLSESLAVANQFLDGGVVIYEQSIESEEVYRAEEGGLATRIPLVVLVNNRTASASELVAGAIRDQERGVLIGQTTFGKGTVQQIFPLTDGSSIHITSAAWFTPDRIPLDGVGLEPIISMIPDENGRDIELGEAIRYLQNVLRESDLE